MPVIIDMTAFGRTVISLLHYKLPRLPLLGWTQIFVLKENLCRPRLTGLAQQVLKDLVVQRQKE